MRETSDLMIDQALAMVGDAQPPIGMQQRLSAHIENQQRVRKQSVVFISPWAWKGILVGAIGIACFYLLTSRPPHKPDSVVAPGYESAGITVKSPVVTPHSAFAQKVAISAEAPYLQRTNVLANKNHFVLSVDDTHAPSKSAPEMPLTAQEKILRRAAHRDDSVLLAQLQPDELAILSSAQTDLRQFLQELVAPMTSTEALERNAPETSSSNSLGSNDSSQQTETTYTSNNGASQ